MKKTMVTIVLIVIMVSALILSSCGADASLAAETEPAVPAVETPVVEATSEPTPIPTLPPEPEPEYELVYMAAPDDFEIDVEIFTVVELDADEESAFQTPEFTIYRYTDENGEEQFVAYAALYETFTRQSDGKKFIAEEPEAGSGGLYPISIDMANNEITGASGMSTPVDLTAIAAAANTGNDGSGESTGGNGTAVAGSGSNGSGNSSSSGGSEGDNGNNGAGANPEPTPTSRWGGDPANDAEKDKLFGDIGSHNGNQETTDSWNRDHNLVPLLPILDPVTGEIIGWQ